MIRARRYDYQFLSGDEFQANMVKEKLRCLRDCYCVIEIWNEGGKDRRLENSGKVWIDMLLASRGMEMNAGLHKQIFKWHPSNPSIVGWSNLAMLANFGTLPKCLPRGLGKAHVLHLGTTCINPIRRYLCMQ